MSHTVAQLAELVEGKFHGDGQRLIDDACAIESAGPTAVTFVLDESHLSRLHDCQAGAIVLEDRLLPKIPQNASSTLIVVNQPQVAFEKLLPLFRLVRSRPKRGISKHAHISSSAKIGADCYIAPGVCIDDDVYIAAGCDLYPGVVIGAGAQVGENSILHPNAVVYHDVIIGKNVIVHSGAVIGADGFGYRFAAGRFEKIPQLGTVHIHDDVEIGACTTIDRGAIGPTVVGKGTKLDNLVMVAHNCELGQHNVLASQVGVAGSSTTGDYVRMGGQSGVRDHVRLNTGSSIGAKAGVTKDIPAGETWIGIPATPESEQKRQLFSIKRIPDMRDDIKAMRKSMETMAAEIEQLKSRLYQAEGPMPHRAAG